MRFFGQPSLDAAIAELAREQHGVVTLAQLGTLGLGPRAAQRRAASGRFHRVHSGVYSLAPPALPHRRGRFMAAVLACGPGAALSHRSAAALHELRATDRAAVDVTVPVRTGRRHAGIDVHRSTTLWPQDITSVDGIPVTTIARTLLDLARVVNLRAQERALTQAEILEVLDHGAMTNQIERNATRVETKRLRAALEIHRGGLTPTWSRFEEAFLAVCRSAGVPRPEINVWIAPDARGPAIRADFVWRAPRLVVETDGWRTHRTRAAFEIDRQRDQRLLSAGWRTVRITWRQLSEEPERIAALLRALLQL